MPLLPPVRVAKLFRSLSTYSSSSSSLILHKLSLQTLLKTGSTPTLRDFNNHLLFLSKIHRFNLILNFYDQMTSNLPQVDSHTRSIFKWALLKSHDSTKTHRVHSSDSSKNRIWDTLIRGLCIDQIDPETAFSVLQDGLKNFGIFPSSYTFRLLIHSFCSMGEMEKAIQVLELMTDEKFNYPFNNFVCSSVISGFCKIGKPELALDFFENAEKIGALKPNVVTYTSLVTALCELDRVKEVDDILSKIEKGGLVLDVIFYTNWILGYLKLGILDDAFLIFKQMLDNRIKPDNVIYTVLSDGFSKEGNVEKTIGFLEKMKKYGLQPNLITYTSVMYGFCKKGKLEEALAIFEIIEELGIKVDEFTYATLIDGACRRGDFNCVFSLLEDMERNEISPSIVTYNTVINGLCKFGRTSEADEFSRNLVRDVITYSTLLHGYIEEQNLIGTLETKKRLEEAGVSMDVVMCNVLIKALFMVGEFENAYAIYKEMPKLNLIAKSTTYYMMISGYCKAGRIDEALEIFDDFRFGLQEKGLVLDKGAYKMLIKALFEAYSSEGVLDFINKIENLEPDIYNGICNNAISFLCKRACLEAACDVCMRMRKKGSFITSKSYYNILKGIIGKGKEWLNLPLLSIFVKECGLVERRVEKILIRYLCMKNVKNALLFIQNISAYTATFPLSVLKALTEDGKALDAYKLIVEAKDNLPVMNVAYYSNVVDGLCKLGHLNQALDLCTFARNEGISLNIITYNTVLYGLCKQGSLIEALRIFDSIERLGLVPSEVTFSVLIDALSKEGFLQEAKDLFDKMVLKGLTLNTLIYNSLIIGYCKFGRIIEALNLLQDLEKKFLDPDGFTISAMIHGYCLKGDMEAALNFFFDFNKKDILPDFLGFLNLVKGLCSKGRMEEARSILREMLQAPSILQLINQVDAEVQTESIESFLVFLCEQGSIKEAITILDEVRLCMSPSFGKSLTSYKSQKSMGFVGIDEFRDSAEGNAVQSCGLLEKRSRVHDDFNTYYSVLASFCSKGEMHKANKLIKEAMLP